MSFIAALAYVTYLAMSLYAHGFTIVQTHDAKVLERNPTFSAFLFGASSLVFIVILVAGLIKVRQGKWKPEFPTEPLFVALIGFLLSMMFFVSVAVLFETRYEIGRAYNNPVINEKTLSDYEVKAPTLLSIFFRREMTSEQENTFVKTVQTDRYVDEQRRTLKSSGAVNLHQVNHLLVGDLDPDYGFNNFSKSKFNTFMPLFGLVGLFVLCQCLGVLLTKGQDK
ncbi:hypothetical protein [Pseudomonas syringae]|uniref:hypothetical protein n=1 Tax=Pseudomonas syringae TaxID=317 RepID=UPI001237276B|nr:hypothetical protein [Pseudomonas syringae]